MWSPLAAVKSSNGDRKSTRLNSSHTVIYTLSLHDALPISVADRDQQHRGRQQHQRLTKPDRNVEPACRGEEQQRRSEEHTSELQSHRDLHSFPTRRSSDLRCRSRPAASRSPAASAPDEAGP